MSNGVLSQQDSWEVRVSACTIAAVSVLSKLTLHFFLLVLKKIFLTFEKYTVCSEILCSFAGLVQAKLIKKFNSSVIQITSDTSNTGIMRVNFKYMISWCVEG